MALLDVRGLSIDYRVGGQWLPAVKDVSFSVDRGEVLGLVGESGCGKSTVARALLHLLPKNGRISAGTIEFDGQDITRLSHRALQELRWERISMVFQGAMHVLDPVYTVGSQIVEAIRTHRGDVGRRAAWAQAEALLASVGIDQRRARAFPHELSGGMKQRVGIAMAMALSPDLVVADEPTTALDVISQDNVLHQLVQAQREQGTAMVLISHDMGVISETADRVAVMYAGGVVEMGPVKQIFSRPAHPYTLGLKNAIPRLLQEEASVAIPGFPPTADDWPEGCRFAPRCPFAEDICVSTVPPWVEIEPGHAEACHFPARREKFADLARRPDVWLEVEERLNQRRARQLTASGTAGRAS